MKVEASARCSLHEAFIKAQHPVVFALLIAVCVTLGALSFEFMMKFGDSIVYGVLLNASQYQEWNTNWPHVIAGTIWLTGFSVGIMGCGINLLNAFRCRTSVVTNFDMMKDLSAQECEDLKTWLDNSYEPEDLKTLWGEKR